MGALDRIGRALRDPRHAGRIALQAALFRPRLNRPLTRLGGPRLAAYLSGLAIDARGWRAGTPAVLVLDRLYFEKDVVELRRRGRLNYVSLHTHVLSVTQESWLPEELREQISYAPRSTDRHAAGWAKAEAYAAAILERGRRRWGVAAVLASNVDYWQHEAFRRACQAAGMPFLVLCQEQQTVPFTYQLSIDLYRNADFRYTGTGVAVFEGRTRDMLIESGCCRPDQVVVTGAPRLDPWFDGRLAARPADSVTLLAFDGDQYFAPRCYLETLRLFAAASVEHRGGGLDFVLKCKDREDELRAFRHLAGVEHRLVITSSRQLTELFPRSRLVIGYNTLAILEALLSEAEIAIPQWSDAAKPSSDQNVDPHDPLCRAHYRFATGPDQLRAIIADAVATPRPVPDMTARRVLIRRWFHVPPDGSATNAVEDYIRAVLGCDRAAEAAPRAARVLEVAP